jgi:predicted permease
MRQLRAFLIRCSAALTGRRRRDDAEAELASHLEFHIEDGMRSGLSYEEARRRALIRLGGFEQTRQAVRERHGLPFLEDLARDIRYSFRSLARHKAVTVIAIVSIGLGIGANTTIFSLVSRFVLRPAPVGDPATLLDILGTHVGDRCCNNIPWPVYNDLRTDAKSFSDFAAYYFPVPASVGGNGEPERAWGEAVSTNFFDVTQIRMVAGRGFTASEDTQPMIILGERLWRRHFSGDPSLIGKSVDLSGRRFTVVGIAPAAFHSIDQILQTEFWVPLGTAPDLVPNLPKRSARDYHWLMVVGRLKPGVSRAQANAELGNLAARYAANYAATDKDSGFRTEPAGSLPPNFKDTVVVFLSALFIIVLLVLAIACANVANLLFAQAAARQREMAVRVALGATRARLRRQMLVESTLLAFGGGIFGALLSLRATQLLSAVRLPSPVPLDLAVDMDGRVLFFAFLLSLVSGVLLGIAPAWAASRPRLTNALRGEDALARPGRRWTLRNVIVVLQVAMSVVLLSVTILFLRSLEGAAQIDIGFDPHNMLLLSVDPRVHNYSSERTAAFLEQLRVRAAALPGVTSAAFTDQPPLSGGHRSDGFTIAGRDDYKAVPTAELYMASPGYFEAMGIPLLAGRDFRNETANGPRVAIVNKAFAEKLFGNANPIGQHVFGGSWDYEIIGVAGNVKSRSLGEDTRPVLFRSLVQSIAEDASVMGYTLLLRTAGNPAALSEAARRQVYALDPSMAIYNEETMDDHVRTAYFLPRLAAELFGVFGGIGLVLAAIGLYGVMSYSVSRRTREIGIRMAMGAQRGVVQRFVLRQGLVLTAIALAIGWPAAWMLARLAASFLYGVAPHDPWTFIAAPAFLCVIALVACWLPARRAASIHPMQALRTE